MGGTAASPPWMAVPLLPAPAPCPTAGKCPGFCPLLRTGARATGRLSLEPASSSAAGAGSGSPRWPRSRWRPQLPQDAPGAAVHSCCWRPLLAGAPAAAGAPSSSSQSHVPWPSWHPSQVCGGWGITVTPGNPGKQEHQCRGLDLSRESLTRIPEPWALGRRPPAGERTRVTSRAAHSHIVHNSRHGKVGCAAPRLHSHSTQGPSPRLHSHTNAQRTGTLHHGCTRTATESRTHHTATPHTLSHTGIQCILCYKLQVTLGPLAVTGHWPIAAHGPRSVTVRGTTNLSTFTTMR